MSWFDRTQLPGPAPVPRTARAAELPPLVMRCGAFGDMVLLTVLLEQLLARFRRPADVIASGPWSAPLLAGHPAVGRIFVLRSRRTPYRLSRSQQQLVKWLKARGAGPTWFCDRGEGRELLTRGGIPDDYICDSSAYPFLSGENFADRYLRLGSLSPAAFTGLLPPPVGGVARAAHLVVAPEARSALDHWLERRGLGGRAFMVFHPGSRHVARRRLRSHAGTAKYWPEERWAQVVRAVRAHRPADAIIFSGTRAESSLIGTVLRLAGVADAVNAADDLPVTRLLALLQRAASLIAVDTGPAHAAAALGCPTVALFGHIDPWLYRPGGATTPAATLTGTVEGQPNILGIEPEQVIEAWLALTREAPRAAGSVG
ncbi:MAG TPA: glycosyltransferase family 9 protein [Steroidobacteraceae bacterium]|jgi:ADP-heptose:LPS heptosyltransferase|nr:glycosyltransferase family 9 protein [Steroidobacteraceae bacterium]